MLRMKLRTSHFLRCAGLIETSESDDSASSIQSRRTAPYMQPEGGVEVFGTCADGCSEEMAVHKAQTAGTSML